MQLYVFLLFFHVPFPPGYSPILVFLPVFTPLTDSLGGFAKTEVVSLANRVVLFRIGNIRILQLSEATYSDIKNYKMETTDAPTTSIYSPGLRTDNNGVYIIIGEIVIRDGIISAYYADSYNSSSRGFVELGNTNKIAGNIVWSVK